LTLILLLIVSTTAAQDTTTFTLTCYTVDKDFNMTITVGYTSVGGDHFYGSGFDFVTEAGNYPDALMVTPLSYDPFPTLGFASIGDKDEPSVTDPVIHIKLYGAPLPECGVEVTPEPLPPFLIEITTSCPFSAIDAASGLPYCYVPLPSGCVPLPEAYK